VDQFAVIPTADCSLLNESNTFETQVSGTLTSLGTSCFSESPVCKRKVRVSHW
jgi:hypothetical protein